LGFWRKVGYIIGAFMIIVGIASAISAIVASPTINNQGTQIGNIAALAGVSSLALLGFGSMVSGILLIWALIKSGQIERMEKSLKKIANNMQIIESLQKEKLNIPEQRQPQNLIDYEKNSERKPVEKQ
jgi:hypothetical protein